MEDSQPERTITYEQLPEVAKLNRTVREYVEQVERENVSYLGFQIDRSRRAFPYWIESAKPSQCRSCAHKPACTPSATRRTLRVDSYGDVRENVRKLSQTPEHAIPRRARNKIEALFTELRNQVRLRKLRLRGLPRAGEQSILAATVQHIKRLVRFMSKSKEPKAATA